MASVLGWDSDATYKEPQLKGHQLSSKFLMFLLTTIDPGSCKVTGGSLDKITNSGPENCKDAIQKFNKCLLNVMKIPNTSTNETHFC